MKISEHDKLFFDLIRSMFQQVENQDQMGDSFASGGKLIMEMLKQGDKELPDGLVLIVSMYVSLVTSYFAATIREPATTEPFVVAARISQDIDIMEQDFIDMLEKKSESVN